jgi:hypothetical protein
MTDAKQIFASRTIWANIVGLLALGASFFGVNVDDSEAEKLTDAILQALAAVSFIASTIFRLLATRRIAV